MPTKTSESPSRTKNSRSRGSTEPAQAVRTVNGLAVIRDDPLPSALINGNGKPKLFHGYRVLKLEDQTVVFGCGECPNSTDFTGTRGEVQRHRVAEHGMRGGGARKKAVAAEPQLAVPPSIRAMTIDELLMTAAEIEHLGDLVNTLTAERDEYKQRAHSAEMQVRRWERAFTNLGARFDKEPN